MEKQPAIYRSSKSRPTARQLEHIKTNEVIVAFMTTFSEPKDAEFLWLEASKQGHKMSMSSFYGRLKKLVELGLITKIHVANNKFAYKVTPY